MQTHYEISDQAKPGHGAAFTLVELLAVIAVLGVLAALALPALAGSKGRTKIGQCASNLKQFALSLSHTANYALAFVVAQGCDDSQGE